MGDDHLYKYLQIPKINERFLHLFFDIIFLFSP